MKGPTPHIDSYSFGKITIDGETYDRDVIIRPDGVRASWWRKEGHSLHPEDLASVVTSLAPARGGASADGGASAHHDLDPEVIVIGCGAYGVMKIPEPTRKWLSERGIELVALPTPAACERYNELSAETRVVAGLHLTC